MIREHEGLIVDAMAREPNLLVPTLAHYGAALYAPLVAKGATTGVIVLLRDIDKQEFDLSDLAMAESVAKQATLALELASARHAKAQAAQLEDRSQISRDLHDFAIQQLFASGLELSALREDLDASGTASPSALASLDSAITSIDESVGQIRQIIHSLRDPQATVPLVMRLRREVDYVSRLLGFAPRMVIRNLGEEVAGPAHGDRRRARRRRGRRRRGRGARMPGERRQTRARLARRRGGDDREPPGARPGDRRRTGDQPRALAPIRPVQLGGQGSQTPRHLRPSARDDAAGTKIEWMAIVE